ncbi:MAG: hypothetical protein MUC49_17240 [Raineya sp.]|jgi:hypothetical protein|nr:hypothetical protein [Raineya sp.]
MANENVVAIQIPADELKKAQEALNTAKSILEKYLVALTPEKRKALPKMGDKTLPFVEKVTEYTKSKPEFVPAFMKVKDLDIDFQAVNDLTILYRLAEQLTSGLNDSILISGSEAYSNALIYYNSVKQATKNNIPDAKTVFDDLKKRFEKIKTTVSSAKPKTDSKA